MFWKRKREAKTPTNLKSRYLCSFVDGDVESDYMGVYETSPEQAARTYSTLNPQAYFVRVYKQVRSYEVLRTSDVKLSDQD